MDNPALDWEPSGTTQEPQLDPYATVVPTAALPDDVVQKRTVKAQAAFSTEENPPTQQEIHTAVSTNREDLLRQRLADSESLKKMQAKQGLIREVVDTGDTSPDAVAFLQSLSTEEISQPATVLEKKYAEWRISSGLAADESGTVDKGLEDESVGTQVDSSIDRITRKELIQNRLEGVKAKYTQTGLGRTLIDFAADAIPFFTASEDKNVYPDNVLHEGFWPGDNRMSANRDLFAMPMEELVSTLDKMVADADASGDYAPVIKALEAAQEYSAYAGQVDNFWALAAASDLLPTGLTGDLLLGTGRLAIRRIPKALAKKDALAAAKEAVASEAGRVAPAGPRKGPAAPPEAPGAPVKTQTTPWKPPGAPEAAPTPPEPKLTPEETAVSAVAEKASGDPRPIEEIVKAIEEEPLLDDTTGYIPDKAELDKLGEKWKGRPKKSRLPVGEISSTSEFRVTNVSNEEMLALKEGKNSPIGTIFMVKKGDTRPHQIYLNTDRIKEGFKTKWWTGKNGKLPNGAKALPEWAFKSEKEFYEWVKAHEVAHIEAEDPFYMSRYSSVAALEEEVNLNALRALGRTDIIREMYPEWFVSRPIKTDINVSPAPPKVDSLNTQVQGGAFDAQGKRIVYSKSTPPKKAGPKGEFVEPSARGGSRAPNPDPELVVIRAKLQQDFKKSLAKIKELSDKIAKSSNYYKELLTNNVKKPEKVYKKWLDGLRTELRKVRENHQRLTRVIDKFDRANKPHIVVDVPNPRTGGKSSVQIPATEENITRVYADELEQAAMVPDEVDLSNQFVAHGDSERGAADMAFEEVRAGENDTPESLARKLPSFQDPTAAVTGRAAHSDLYKLVLKEAKRWKNVIERQLVVNEALKKVFADTGKGALRWSEEVFQAVKPAMREQMDKYIGTPHTAIKDISIDYLREFDTGFGRLNQIVYKMGTPDGNFFPNVEKAAQFAEDFYGLAPGSYSVELRSPNAFQIRVVKSIDETDPNILKHTIQTTTQTPVSWANTFMAYLRGSAGVSSDMLQANLSTSAHHAKALHDAFMVAAKDIGQMSKKELTNLEALMEVKRDVEKVVVDPKSGQQKRVRGEWFNSAAELEKTYKKAFGEFPSENVVSAYFTMRQMYDFDLLVRNYRLYTQKSRLGIEIAKLHIPIPDYRDPSLTQWVQMKKGVEVKFVDELPAGKNLDVLILNPETGKADLVNTGKSGLEGIKGLKQDGYKIMQIANPDQRPLKGVGVNDNYIQYIVAKDVERSPLTPDQLPATEGGHVRYKESHFVKQSRFETTTNGQKLYLGDRSILGASSSAEAAKHAKAIEAGRQLLKAGDLNGLKEHLKSNTPWTIGQFEDLFRPKLGLKGEVLEEPLLDLNTPITWVRDGQGTNDAAKTHAFELKDHFSGVRDTIDDDTNLYRMLDKKFTGEKDFALQKMIRDEAAPIWKFNKARMISPLETLQDAWAETSRSMATDALKIQAMTNWVEEAADVLQTPIEELRKNPWEALNNPQWNQQYADRARLRTLNAQRLHILNFLAQKDALGDTLDWVRNKLMDSVFDKKGGAAADWVDDHVLPNVRNPLTFMRSFAFHSKMGFFNPIQLFLQSATMVNTFAITGNPARVGSALSGVMLMHAARFNRTPEILASLGKKAEKLGWKPGEWEEMERTFRELSLHIVEGEVGTLDIMTTPKVFSGKLGMALDKGLMFFREAERNVRANAWAVAYKEFRDKNPTKVLNNEDINFILRRQEILSGNMTRGSNALWQTGLTGPMTQFWGYQARITEQLLGKQLSRAEKLRLGLSFAALYGIPVSLASATMFQVPGFATDDIRQYAQDNGIDVNSGLASIAMNGLVAEGIRWATSDENGQNGLLLNVGDRYGPGGLPVFKNLFEARDGTFDAVVDLAFGASGSIVRDAAKHMLPDSWDVIESASNLPNLTLNDFSNMFSTISTVSNTTKLLWALQTHKAYTRDGLELGDKSAVSAWVTFTTGLDEQWVKDTMLKMDSMKDLKAANDELRKEYVKQIRAAMQLPSGSPERAARIQKARGLGIGVDPNEFKKWVKDALRGGALRDSVDKQYDKKKEFLN